MDKIQLGGTEIVVSRLAYGCMRVSGTWNPADLTAAMIANGKTALRTAYEGHYAPLHEQDDDR